MTIAWYDPTNHHVSTDKHDPLFTPLGQIWPLHRMPSPLPEKEHIVALKKSLKKTYENGYNFTTVEMDWVVRGLFALHKQQPPEAAAIQQLINKLANTVYQVEPLTDEEIKECSYDAEGFMISREGAMRNVEKAHGIGEKE